MFATLCSAFNSLKQFDCSGPFFTTLFTTVLKCLVYKIHGCLWPKYNQFHWLLNDMFATPPCLPHRHVWGSTKIEDVTRLRFIPRGFTIANREAGHKTATATQQSCVGDDQGSSRRGCFWRTSSSVTQRGRNTASNSRKCGTCSAIIQN